LLSFDFVIIFVILWWIVLFIMLPFGIEKEKDTELGNDPGAPKNPMIKKKIFHTTIITFIVTTVIVLLKNEIF